jgi:hypothetical protein
MTRPWLLSLDWAPYIQSFYKLISFLENPPVNKRGKGLEGSLEEVTSVVTWKMEQGSARS